MFFLDFKNEGFYFLVYYYKHVCEQFDLWSVSLSNPLTKKLLKPSCSHTHTHTDYLRLPGLYLTLTEVIGDVIRNVDLPITRLAPLAALAGAGVGVSLCLAVDSNVSFGQDGLIIVTD